MTMSNKQKLDNLGKEIDNLVALLVKVDEGSETVDTLTGQKQKVFDLLPVTPDDGRDDGTYPMHKLLLCRPLTQTKIPLDVLENLIESGFNVNSLYWNSMGDEFHERGMKDTCLNLAIRNAHYEAVRWLVQHGADCDIVSMAYEKNYDVDYCTIYEDTFKTPINELASKANAPLDMFDLLASPESLNDEKSNSILPLEVAINEGHTENALRLIKLGSPIKSRYNELMIQQYLDTLGLIKFGSPIKSRYNELMIQQYLDTCPMQYHDELFTRLIPSETIDILKCVDTVLEMEEEDEHENENESEGNEGNDSEDNEGNDSKDENEVNDIQANHIKYQMLNYLFQYIIPKDQMCICIEKNTWCMGQKSPLSERYNIKMNNETFVYLCSLEHMYWWSLLLVNLGWHFKSTPQSIFPLLPASASEEDVQLAHRIDDIWKTYRDTCSIISLQNLCIQQTRRSMQDFSQESFMSLPVPIKLRKLLMYQHVAEIACEAVSCKLKIP